MKKQMYIMLIVFCTCILSACSTGLKPIMHSSDGKYSDNRFSAIIDALNEKDHDKIKAMFSETALSEAEDIDGGIDYLFDFVPDEITSTEDIVRGSTRADIDEGEKTKWMSSWYYAYAGKQKYLVFFKECMTDTLNPENEGMYMIQIIYEKDMDEQFDGGGPETICAGIYIPDKEN